jgi:hypothetical protein
LVVIQGLLRKDPRRVARASGSAFAGKQTDALLGYNPGTAMIEFHKIWIDQCEAARDIRDAFGSEKAIGYLIGEKFLNFLEASDEDAAFATELPRFVEEIRQIFEPPEISAYLDGVRRVGALGHVCTDDVYEEMRDAGAVSEDPVMWAQQILRLEQARRLLLP